jgi:hypothetical protein
MPKLSKTAGNQQTHRIAIPDEVIAWCGWKSDSYVDIIRVEEPITDMVKTKEGRVEATTGVKRYIKIESMDFDEKSLEAIWEYAVMKSVKRNESNKKKK